MSTAAANAAGNIYIQSANNLTVGALTTATGSPQNVNIRTTGTANLIIATNTVSPQTNDSINLTSAGNITVNTGATLRGAVVTVTADGSITAGGPGTLLAATGGASNLTATNGQIGDGTNALESAWRVRRVW